MAKLHYTKVLAATINVRVANVQYHKQQICELMVQAQSQGIALLCLPELCLTGYTCQDLFLGQKILQEAKEALLDISKFSIQTPDVVVVVGLPFEYGGRLYNCAAVVEAGRICGLVPKTTIPTHQPMAEQRWFTSADTLHQPGYVNLDGQSIPLNNQLVFQSHNYCFGIEFVQDMLSSSTISNQLVNSGADIILHPAAVPALNDCNNDLLTSMLYLNRVSPSAHVLTSAGWGESTTDFVFFANAIVVEDGKIIYQSSSATKENLYAVVDIDIDSLRYIRRLRVTKPHAVETCHTISLTASMPVASVSIDRVEDALPFVPQGAALDATCYQVLQIQSSALARRIEFTHAKCIVIGVSGGLDSTLALLVCTRAMDILERPRNQIVAVTMPGFGTTGRTYQNALQMMSLLGVDVREISIRQACQVHLNDIGHPLDVHDVTYENAQARERTQILMDLANQMGGFVVGTGDMSELALGWATYGGDHISMYGVNGAIPKTLVKALVEYEARTAINSELTKTLVDVVQTPISPELLPTHGEGDSSQVTEDLVGPYELHDFYLYHFLHYGATPKQIYLKALRAFDGHDSRVSQHTSDTIKKWLKIFFHRFFMQQFKRNCLPDGPAISLCCLSPRGGWMMPSDADAAIWLADLEQL